MFSSQKKSREFSATIFFSTAFCSVDNEEVFHKVLHESVCYLYNDDELNTKPRAHADFLGSACALDYMRCGIQTPIYTRKTRKNNYIPHSFRYIYIQYKLTLQCN